MVFKKTSKSPSHYLIYTCVWIHPKQSLLVHYKSPLLDREIRYHKYRIQNRLQNSMKSIKQTLLIIASNEESFDTSSINHRTWLSKSRSGCPLSLIRWSCSLTLSPWQNKLRKKRRTKLMSTPSNQERCHPYIFHLILNFMSSAMQGKLWIWKNATSLMPTAKEKALL